MGIFRDTQSKGSSHFLPDAPVVLESLTWIAAWFLLPIWLALGSAGGLSFLAYALGAGACVSLGTALNEPLYRSGLEEFMFLLFVTTAAVLVSGGAVFAVTKLIAS